MMIAAIGKSGSIGSQFRDKQRTVEPISAENRADRNDDQDPKTPSTALVSRDPARSRQRTAATVWFNRPSAPFLTHLIATRADMPQTRARRRAEPSEAVVVYGNTAARIGYRQPGMRFQTSL